MFLRTLMLCAGLSLVGAAQASYTDFSHTDWKTSGDELATLHVDTGMEWLKVTETQGMSVDQVLTETQAGGAYEGWRLPTSGEIVTLWNDMFEGSTMLSNPQGTRRDYSLYSALPQAWVEFMGMTTSSPIRAYGYGYKTNGQLGFFGVSRASGTTSYWYGYGDYSTSNTSNLTGVFLVSDGGDTLSSKLDPTLNINNPNAPINSVPVMAMGGLALLGLGLRRKYKSHV
jgi:hypothetical protein